jgi:hypothetical protein
LLEKCDKKKEKNKVGRIGARKVFEAVQDIFFYKTLLVIQ